VLTDLFALVSGIEPSRVTGAIPPACRRGVDSLANVSVDGDTVLLEAPQWLPRSGARHLVPAFSLLSPHECSFRFETSVYVAGEWTPWIAAVSIGPDTFPAIPARAGGIEAEIDLFASRDPVARVRLRLRARPASVLTLPWLVTLSASDLVPGVPSPPRSTATTRLAVPPKSQMSEPAAIRERICSPTSVAMVLEYWSRRTEVGAIAAEVFHPGLDRYGVWPAAILAAGRRGVAGYLLRFPDWEAAAWCIEHGIPIIVSVRYEEGELHGAAIARTSGHLLVLTGRDGDHVLVNDPAAEPPCEVVRRYRLEEFSRVWLERAGVGYVLFDPSRSPP
jgi:hypothetical protein